MLKESQRKELELYIHIPFCIKKCAYCDFLSGPASKERVEEYVTALQKEILACKQMGENYKVSTIFLGGGTPSILTGSQMIAVMKCIYETFEMEENAEITMEVNPGTVTEEKLKAYKEAGMNRISFGLQSVNDEELKMLGRIHTLEEFLESYRLARKVGFHNINIDLISAIPGQTVKSWEHTLKTAVELKPEHISAYSLIIEEGTPFAKLYGEGGEKQDTLPDEETERQIYRRTEEILKKFGYHRYEISNYAKEGYVCRHNLGYWERKNYLGLGLGASSLVEEIRFHNTDVMEEYLKNVSEPEKVRKDIEHLTLEERMEEFIFLGLRKMEGISEVEFASIFGKSIWECYGENIQRVLDKELMEKCEERLRLTEKGIDISNYVFAQILA